MSRHSLHLPSQVRSQQPVCRVETSQSPKIIDVAPAMMIAPATLLCLPPLHAKMTTHGLLRGTMFPRKMSSKISTMSLMTSSKKTWVATRCKVVGFAPVHLHRVRSRSGSSKSLMS